MKYLVLSVVLSFPVAALAQYGSTSQTPEQELGMLIVSLILGLIPATLLGWLTSHLAKNKGRGSAGWFWGGFFFGLFALIYAAMQPTKSKAGESE